MSTDNKKRQPNFTADEIEVLVREVERNGKVLTCDCPKYKLAGVILKVRSVRAAGFRASHLTKVRAAVRATPYTLVFFVGGIAGSRFPPILRLFAIFDRNFVKIAAPSSDEYEKYIVPLKEESPVKKTLQTASKSGNKRQRNACSNYAPLERTVSK